MLVLATLLFVPILIPLSVYSERAMTLMVGDGRIAQLAAHYLKIVSIGMPFQVWATCYSEFFKCQGKPRYILISTIMASICHWILSYILCVKLGMRLEGVAIATASYFMIRFAIREMICRFDSRIRRETVGCIFESCSWEGLSKVHSMGWSSMTNKVMTWWAFDIFT